MQIGAEKLCDEIATKLSEWVQVRGYGIIVHVLEGRNEDVAEGDNLGDI